MNVEGASTDILEQYKAISNKLKKRYFRKPNLTEASKSFASLAVQCEMNELSYAAMCWIAASRCEFSLGNIVNEANFLIRAARQFMKMETKDRSIGYPCSESSSLQAALSCYSWVCNRSPENKSFNVGFYLEIANELSQFDKNEHAQSYLMLAAAQSSMSLDTRLYCLSKLASSYLKSANYISALTIFTEIYDSLEGISLTGAQTDTVLECEISRVFLLLILKPTPQRLDLVYAKLLEKYMWGDINDTTIRVPGMSEHLFILMQSLVMACQSLDTVALPEIEADFWPHLSNDLRSLLRNLVNQYNV